MKILKGKGVEFRLSVVGEQFREGPDVFEWAKEYFADAIDHWGYQESAEKYRDVLGGADIVVSTAGHEFFGVSVVEAIAAGCYPVLPKRLAYPEIVRCIEAVERDEFFYDGTVEGLARKLEVLIGRIESGEDLWGGRAGTGQLAMRLYAWDKRAEVMDNDLEGIFAGESGI